jgi:serine/threonine-protein kinase RsbT
VVEHLDVAIRADVDIVTARQRGRTMAETVGFSATDATLIATAISEVARNILTYAGEGLVRLRSLYTATQVGIEVIAQDTGPGIADLDRALSDGFSTGQGLGLGLPGARRLMDEFSIEAPVGVGTTVVMRKWTIRRAG